MVYPPRRSHCDVPQLNDTNDASVSPIAEGLSKAPLARTEIADRHGSSSSGAGTRPADLTHECVQAEHTGREFDGHRFLVLYSEYVLQNRAGPQPRTKVVAT